MLRKFALALTAVGTIGAGAALMPSEASAGGYGHGYGSYYAPVTYYRHSYRPIYRHYGHRPIYRHYGYRPYRHYGYGHRGYGHRGYGHGYGGRGISLRFGGGGFY